MRIQADGGSQDAVLHPCILVSSRTETTIEGLRHRYSAAAQVVVTIHPIDHCASRLTTTY